MFFSLLAIYAGSHDSHIQGLLLAVHIQGLLFAGHIHKGVSLLVISRDLSYCHMTDHIQL